MANIAVNSQYMLLNWLLGGTLPTRPTTWAIGLSLGAPSSVSGSEISGGSGYTRQTAATMFNTVVSGSNTMTNLSALTFGPFSSAQSISGILVWDTLLSNNAGNMLWYGTLVAPRTVSVGDTIVLASGQLSISLA